MGHKIEATTDFTTPASSDSGPDCVDMDEVEEFRDREYPQLKGQIYLDHGGTTLYAKSLIEEFSADMVSNLYGNPHSASTPSALAGHRVDAVRERALRFFNADPEEWDLVFVANATAAIKLVIECFRDHAAASNTPVWPGKIRKTFHKAATYTLLDAAALASTAPLSLADTATAPDFVALSFYKIFGFPNVGALLVQKKSQHVLENRRYFGGGTVDMIISINDTWHAKKETSLHERLEDGTLPFHSIFALDHAMNVHERLYGPNPMKFISHHTAQLGKQMYDGLLNLRHGNGRPLVRIYKDENAIYGDPSVQGSTIAFNVQGADGKIVGYEEVEEAADERKIFVRSGSLCNPGGVATYLNWSPTEMKAAFAAGHRCSHPTQVMLGKPTGVVRVSMGAMSIAADVQGFLNFLREEYLDCDSKTHVAETVSISQQSAYQARTVNISSVPHTPTSISAPVLGIPHALYVPPSPRPDQYKSTAPSVAPSTTSEVKSMWEIGQTALPPTQPSTSNHFPSHNGPASPQPNEYYFPGKLARQGQHHSGGDLLSSTKSTSGVTGVATVELKFSDIQKGDNGGAQKTGSVKSRRFGRSVANLLHRKGHIPSTQYSHPDIG
ncbi:hypothetical protein MBLNU459_g0117t1 [Dothideomycetes sp. NU459]